MEMPAGPWKGHWLGASSPIEEKGGVFSIWQANRGWQNQEDAHIIISSPCYHLI
jgi:hypothetical protein